jgi:hypothetical protein
MTRPMKQEFNVATQVETIVELNDDEYTLYLEEIARQEALPKQDPNSVI